MPGSSEQSHKVKHHPHKHALSYAVADNGIELPVLDVTHPQFISSIDEKNLEALAKDALQKVKTFKKMPDWYKRFLGKRSFILGGFLLKKSDDIFLNGMSTMMVKLGPGLIGGGRKRFFDRLAAKGFSAVSIRMRVRDMAQVQAEALAPLLRKSAERNLCFINIAGGAACDSINALFLIQEKDPALLKNRALEINVLDIDTFGPNFAAKSIKSLLEPGGRLQGLNVSCRNIPYNWNNTEKLIDLLSERKDWLQVCSSEGGLYEYGADEEIIQNLQALHQRATADMVLVGDVLWDLDRVSPAIVGMTEVSGIKARFMGFALLKKLAERANWEMTRHLENNPTYMVFCLRKKG